MENGSIHNDRLNGAASLENTCLIGVDLGATNLRVARVKDGEIQQVEYEPIISSEIAEDLVDQIGRLIKKTMSPSVQAIGIGVPSVVDVKQGIVYDVQNIPSWDEVPLKDLLEKRLELPVYVNNDANCFVLGEKYFGHGVGYDSIVGLVLGSGFGGGLVLNGKLYSGINCGAGEVGMLPYKESIFEHYCSGMFFEREFNVTGTEAYEKARTGNEEGKIMYESFGAHLGNAIKAVMYAYDPELIVLGGSVSKAYPYFRNAMEKALRDFAYPKSIENLAIKVSELEYVAVLGAATLALDFKLK